MKNGMKRMSPCVRRALMRMKKGGKMKAGGMDKRMGM
jgi:hypothetical protein